MGGVLAFWGICAGGPYHGLNVGKSGRIWRHAAIRRIGYAESGLQYPLIVYERGTYIHTTQIGNVWVWHEGEGERSTPLYRLTRDRYLLEEGSTR